MLWNEGSYITSVLRWKFINVIYVFRNSLLSCVLSIALPLVTLGCSLCLNSIFIPLCCFTILLNNLFAKHFISLNLWLVIVWTMFKELILWPVAKCRHFGVYLLVVRATLLDSRDMWPSQIRLGLQHHPLSGTYRWSLLKIIVLELHEASILVTPYNGHVMNLFHELFIILNLLANTDIHIGHHLRLAVVVVLALRELVVFFWLRLWCLFVCFIYYLGMTCIL